MTKQEKQVKARGLILMLGIAVLAGCSTKPTALSIQKDEEALTEAREAAEAKRIARANEKAEKFLKRVPDWVTTPPRGDGVNVYAVGSGVSSKLDVARQKAVLSGEFGLAKQYRQALSGSERMYQREGSGTAGVQERYTLLIDKLVDRVELVGHEVVRSETIAVDGGQYQTWVLMKLSFDDMERILARQRDQSAADASIDRQFEELDRRLKELRKEQREDRAASKAAVTAPVVEAKQDAGSLGVPPPIKEAIESSSLN